MAEKRMLIIDTGVARKIDENRGDMSCSEFLDFLIDSLLEKEANSQNRTDKYVDKEEFDQFVRGMKELLHNFIEFFISYELELGEKPSDEAFAQMSQKLKALGGSAK